MEWNGRFIPSIEMSCRGCTVDMYISSKEHAYINNAISHRKLDELQGHLCRTYNFPRVIIICKGHIEAGKLVD